MESGEGFSATANDKKEGEKRVNKIQLVNRIG